MKTVIDTNGQRWRVDTVIDGAEGCVQLNISPENSDTPNQRGITLPLGIAQQWMDGIIRVKVSTANWEANREPDY